MAVLNIYIMPEAVKEMLRHAFEDCGKQKVWIGYYEGNTKSRRIREKCGFKYQWRSEDVDVPLMHEKTDRSYELDDEGVRRHTEVVTNARLFSALTTAV